MLFAVIPFILGVMFTILAVETASLMIGAAAAIMYLICMVWVAAAIYVQIYEQRWIERLQNMENEHTDRMLSRETEANILRSMTNSVWEK